MSHELKLTKNDMYWAGEYLGFTTPDHKLLESNIPAEDISNPDKTRQIMDRLRTGFLRANQMTGFKS